MFRRAVLRALLLASCLALFVISVEVVTGTGAGAQEPTPNQQWVETVTRDAGRYHMAPYMMGGTLAAGESGRWQAPVIVGDDHRLVYQSYERREWNIYYDGLDGTDPLLLAQTGHSEVHPRLNRGATRIVFASDRDGDYELFAVDPDGANLTQLTHNNTDDVHPSWSPDGQQIVFEAYRNGQAEIYVMAADGSNQRRLTQRAGADITPTWSPDGSSIAFASYDNGQYQIYRMDADGNNLTHLETDMPSIRPAWSPDGQTIAFSGDGDGDGWYELWTMAADGSNVQQRRNGVAETDFLVNGWIGNAPQQSVVGTEVSYTFSDGAWFWNMAQLFEWILDGAFLPFGDDSEVIWHPDVTSVDSSAPLMSAIVMPEYSRQRVQVGWLHAPDTGGTGTYGYDVDVQEYPGGPWEALSRQQTQNEIDESFPAGKAYRFRVRALDGAYNYSAWLVTMPTNVYTWKVESHVVDNRGNALPYATVTTNPPSFVAFEGNAIYHNYVGDVGSPYEVSWSLDGYGPLPDGYFNLSDGDATALVVLPPQNNIIVDGTFEAGTLAAWQRSDPQTISLRDSGARTGTYSAYMDVNAGAATTLSQEVTIPADMPEPALSFMYQLSADIGITPQLEVQVSDSLATQTVLSLSGAQADWGHAWVDLSDWAGETVTLTFRRPAGIRVANLDDVSLGSTAPDLWLATSGALSAMPGETVTRVLHYGNRGGVIAPDSEVTITLPASMSFVSATPAPSGTNPYRWDLADLAPGATGEIILELTMSNSATPGEIRTVQTHIETPYEAYLLNNDLALNFLVGRQILMPLIMRP